MRKTLKRMLAATAVAAALIGGAMTPAQASGTQHLPMGLSDFMAGVLPPPGFYWLNYVGAVTKDKAYAGSKDVSSAADPDVSVYFDAFRFVYMTPIELFGANYGAQVILPVYTADLKINTPGGRLKSDTTGLGDITINPIILAWHFSPNFHMGAGVDIVLPTGNYDDKEPATTILSKNHITFEPLVALSYWVPGGVDLSTKIMLDFHTENTKIDLEPGSEFHFDWAASYALTPDDEWRAGLIGWYYTQLEKDKYNGSSAGEELASQYAVGVAAKYWPKMGPLSFTAKYYKEMGTENTLEGQSFWLNFTWAL